MSCLLFFYLFVSRLCDIASASLHTISIISILYYIFQKNPAVPWYSFSYIFLNPPVLLWITTCTFVDNWLCFLKSCYIYYAILWQIWAFIIRLFFIVHHTPQLLPQHNALFHFSQSFSLRAMRLRKYRVSPKARRKFVQKNCLGRDNYQKQLSLPGKCPAHTGQNDPLNGNGKNDLPKCLPTQRVFLCLFLHCLFLD